MRLLGRVLFLPIALLVLLSVAGRASAIDLVETPSLAARVAAGELPPVADRLPETPLVVDLDGPEQSLGEPGGTLKILMGRQKDIRMMTVYGYARLVGYDRNLNIVPDILESYEQQGLRRFTFHLRKGHRWSDGQPFTAEDFRYFWEDVANNEELSPFGPPKTMVVDGEAPRFEVLDKYTVRYTWTNPNPYFLPALAGARPLYIYMPAHYMKQFHVRYADPDKLARLIEETHTRNWAGLHHRMDEQYRQDNVDMPNLQPWRNVTPSPAERYVFERNPYFHKVDSAGHQLPYIDRIIVNIADSSLIPAKAGFGESDLQARYIRFDHYTFLKRGAKQNDFDVRLWHTARGAQIALYPNLNAADPVWRDVLRDVRFRRALSLAIDRELINQVLYFGLARPSANTVLPKSPLFEPAYRDAWTDFDLETANRLLDDMGLTDWSGGIRRLPDGRRLQVIVDTAGESTEESDALELIKNDWRRIGVELFTKPSQREVFRNRVFAGSAIMSVWTGLENGVPTADMAPIELAPTAQDQLEWPKWGEYYQTEHASGEAPDMPEVQRLVELNRAWRYADSADERRDIWHKMLAIHADQVFTIGVVNGVPQPVVVSRALRNVPEDGLYNWDPGAYFGIYHPDTFWLTAARREAVE